jgi:hypothetical protein
MAPDDPLRIFRGAIDCLIRRPDGSICVIEFKTGVPEASHQAQLDCYVRAATAMFPLATVVGRILYAI